MSLSNTHEQAIMSGKSHELEIPGLLHLHVEPSNGSWLLYVNEDGEWNRYTEEGVRSMKLCAQPLEKTIQTNIIRYLNSLPNTKAVKWGQDGRQKGNPDVLCCQDGQIYLFEVKRPEVGKLTELQIATIKAWRKVGAVAYVVESVEDVQVVLASDVKPGIDSPLRLVL